MNHQFRHITLVFYLLLTGTGNLIAQADTLYGPGGYEGVELRPFDQAQWEGLVKDLDYPVDQLPERRPAGAQKTSDNSGFWATLFKVIFIAIPIGILGWMLWKVSQSPIAISRNKTEGRAVVSKPKQTELREVMELSQDEEALQSAIRDGDFTQAVRLYYLKIIAALVRHRQIQWRKEKTNSDYLRELRRQAYYAEYEWLTRQYENAWYGKQPVSAESFQQLVPRFRQLEQQIQSTRP